MTSRPIRLLFVALAATGLAACQEIADTPAHTSTTAPVLVTAASRSCAAATNSCRASGMPTR